MRPFKVGDTVICKPYGISEVEGVITQLVVGHGGEIGDFWVETVDNLYVCSIDKAKLKNKWEKITI